MRWSRTFLPTMKDTPAEAQIASHRFMLRAGMVRQNAAGIYTWLPLGLRVLTKIADIVRDEQARAGANEVLMPTIQSADLWQESGRFDAYGPEMLRFEDRHGRTMLYGPTNEEMITDIFRREVQSYKNLPLNLYHIQWKFRDEVRPRFGVMRGREFLMKDGYSFDVDEASAALAYKRVFISYLRTFRRLGLSAIPMKADTGPIGGDLSHEFLIQAETGESEVFFDSAISADPAFTEDLTGDAELEAAFDRLTSAYARTDETHEAALFEQQVPAERRVVSRGSKSATSSTSAPNTRTRWARRYRTPRARTSPFTWAPTASASRGWSAGSSRQATMRTASSGPRKSPLRRWYPQPQGRRCRLHRSLRTTLRAGASRRARPAAR